MRRAVTMELALAKDAVTDGPPLAYEHSCLVKASRMIRRVLLDCELSQGLELDLANIADQVTDAECGLRRHLGLPEPSEEPA